MGRRTVRITRNFDKNLVGIRRFLEEQEAPREFQSVLEQLFGTVVPNLERFPEMGVDFLAKAPQSTEGLMRLETLKRRLGKNTSLREYISGDYLVLYALRGDNIYLLSIKHHRQLSFDLKGHWGR
ncbi:MAG: type II toxin-antitoxin system RelE/ParE family toxin [Gammaproteobacteria bacterium]|nr:type II toxin-antitoxin system RelE/ParE family toxin [Gammaproteobacteria bacterium]